jgi:NAD+ kinase
MDVASSTSPARRPRVMVLGSRCKPAVLAQADRLRGVLEQCADIVVWDLGFEAELSSIDADLAVVLGGDGSILHAAHQMGFRQVPVIGVNLGKLGFLAGLSPDQFVEKLPAICAGHYRVIDHLMLECSLTRGGKVVWTELGLNEVAVVAGPPFAIMQLHLYVDAELVTTYSCDGLIVSTPVGSTAHSLSAGGPILRKDMQAFVVSPISPHTLTNRPVVDAADRVYEVIVPSPSSEAMVVVDGRVLGPLEPDDRLRVSRARPTFKMVEVPGQSYYRTLREKLGWGGSLNLNDST